MIRALRTGKLRTEKGRGGLFVLQSTHLGENHPESATLPLISAGYLDAYVTELLLHGSVVDLCRGRYVGAKIVVGKYYPALVFGQIATQASRQHGSLDELDDVLVVEPIGADRLAATGR